MEKTKQEICDLSDFDDTVSLWQLIPAGKGKALTLLKIIVDAIHNGNNDKLQKILITGEAGRIHGLAFLRALGFEQIKEINASLLQYGTGLVQFFCKGPENAHLITNAEMLMSMVQLPVCHVLKFKKFNLYNFLKEGIETFSAPGPLILTTEDVKKVQKPIVDICDYVIDIEPYTQEQLKLVVLQRLKYAGIDYECEEVLNQIVSQGNKLKQIIRFLKICIAVMQANGRNKELQLGDIEKAIRMR